mgnify:CR=1 FL=1
MAYVKPPLRFAMQRMNDDAWMLRQQVEHALDVTLRIVNGDFVSDEELHVPGVKAIFYNLTTPKYVEADVRNALLRHFGKEPLDEEEMAAWLAQCAADQAEIKRAWEEEKK